MRRSMVINNCSLTISDCLFEDNDNGGMHPREKTGSTIYYVNKFDKALRTLAPMPSQQRHE